ncbi:MAG: SURF1 family protein [Chloroflexota bacterium]
MSLLRTLFSRRWLLATVLVLLGIGVLARLGVWQLDRLAQRREENAVLRVALASNILELPGASLPEDTASLKDRQVVAQGSFDFTEQVSLEVQDWQGQAGIHLLVPLVFADGETAVLVDRGWLPDAEADSANWAAYDEVGDVTVQGVVALTQLLTRRGTAVQPDSPQAEWYRVDVAAIQNQLPYTLLPFYIIQAPAADGTLALPYRALPEVDLSEGPHLSYAIQWFLFSLILGGGYIYYVRVNGRAH